MKKLKIKNTAKTPGILFNPNGKLEISGISVPENAIIFYETVIEWVKEYVKCPVGETVLVFKFVYINTSSLQFIYDILSLLATINTTSNAVKIDWYYDAEDIAMKETGEDYDETINVPFNFIELTEV